MSLPHTRDNPSKKRAPKAGKTGKACSSCHTRKLRCDLSDIGFPCTRCRADEFECVGRERKKRRTRCLSDGPHDIRTASPLSHSTPEHILLHKFPHYRFFRTFRHSGQQPWLHAQDRNHGILLPIPALDTSAFSHESHATTRAAHLQFLKQMGAFELPPKETMDQYVSTYFHLLHPFFPVIDKASFLHAYNQSNPAAILSDRGPSLLLLHAVIFSASSAVPIEHIHNLGFSSRKLARSCLHRRVRYLYDFDYESDDIIVIQTLLLISHYYPSMVEQKHTWLWVHQAISLAQGAGLHRDPGQTPQRKLWARVWWACLVRDRLITLGTGRPMHINSLDCTVPLLTSSDLQEDGDSDEDRAVKAMFIDLIKLCQYTEGVLSLPLAAPDSLPEQTALCDKALEHWLSNLDPVARRDERAAIGSDHGSVAALYRGVLHLVYNTVLIALRQSGRVLDTMQADTRRAILPEAQLISQDSTRLIVNLTELGVVPFCPTVCVTTVLPPILVHLQTIRSSSEDGRSPYPASRDFQNCMEFLNQLGDIYWHASFYHDFFKLAVSNTQAVIESDKGPSTASVSLSSSNRTSGRQVGPVQGQQRNSKLTVRGGSEMDGEQQIQLITPLEPIFLDRDRHDETVTDCNVPSLTDRVIEDTESFDPLDMENSTLLGQGSHIWDSWLDDYGLFQSLFPSA